MAITNPMDLFFSFAPKDPKQKADFEYCLYWIMFLTFAGMCINYFILFFNKWEYAYIGWGILMLIMTYFQYANLKMQREMRMFQRKPLEKPSEMMAEFK